MMTIIGVEEVMNIPNRFGNNTLVVVNSDMMIYMKGQDGYSDNFGFILCQLL